MGVSLCPFLSTFKTGYHSHLHSPRESTDFNDSEQVMPSLDVLFNDYAAIPWQANTFYKMYDS